MSSFHTLCERELHCQEMASNACQNLDGPWTTICCFAMQFDQFLEEGSYFGFWEQERKKKA